jgi:hypothetical protein
MVSKAHVMAILVVAVMSKVKLVPDFDKKVGWSEGYSTKMVAGGKKLNHLLEKDST